MMSKEEFVNGLLEAQETRMEAAEKAKENKIIEKPETHEKETIVGSSTIEKAFNNLVAMILTEEAENDKLYWYTRGIMAVVGE